jgi:hypothetical protein
VLKLNLAFKFGRKFSETETGWDFEKLTVSGPFQQWGLDFIGEIHPNSSGQHRWILTATDYFT